MLVHFICRGNAFRSRMAEAYFNSLQLKGARAISSGSVANLHSLSNKNNFRITQSLLIDHGLIKYTKKHWNQLTQRRLKKADLTVCLSKSVMKECSQLFDLPKNTLIWEVPDFDEITPVPKDSNAIREYSENTFYLIKTQVDKLATTIK